jgi:hypothetical protein
VFTFTSLCTRCHQLTAVDIYTPCPNRLANGMICGFALTTTVMSGNQKTRGKGGKHTRPRPSGEEGIWSWTEPAKYDHLHEAAMVSGSLCFDLQNKYFCATNPVNSGDAKLQYVESGPVAGALTSITPLNSKWQALHTFFGGNTSGMINFGTGDFVIASSGAVASGVRHNIVTVLKDGKVIALYDPIGSGFIKF